MAMSALERIQDLLQRRSRAQAFGPPTTMRELAARAQFAGRPLPPSYVTAMRHTSSIGEPERFLDAQEMALEAEAMLGGRPGAEKGRYIPFCATLGDVLYCFDQNAPQEDGELPIMEFAHGIVKTTAVHFGELLDRIADEREEALEKAAEIPKSLRDLLLQLGFRFEDPIVGKVSTGDVAAVEALLGPERTVHLREEIAHDGTRRSGGRLFDATGKAHLTLNLDEFALTCTLRTGTLVFEAEEVFRWLRTFRDENFFGESYREPSHPDQVRDLRKAPREAPMVVRGVLEVTAMPARRHVFHGASGASRDSFYVLGRAGGEGRTTSLILHVVNGEVKAAHNVDQPLHAVYAGDDDTVWGLSNYGAVVRFAGGKVDTFPLERAAGSLTWWYGIGEFRGRILVWGTGALHTFDGQRFVPFRPDARLEKHEAVVALSASSRALSMLVCGERAGAVARYDERDGWAPITEDHVVDADLADYDVWRGMGILLGQGGELWRIEDDGMPRSVLWESEQPAFLNEVGLPRPTFGVRGFDGGALLASEGGVIAAGPGDPVFHTVRGAREPVRLSRVGREAATPPPLRRKTDPANFSETGETAVGPGGAALVATFGPHVWLWTGASFRVLDMRAW